MKVISKVSNFKIESNALQLLNEIDANFRADNPYCLMSIGQGLFEYGSYGVNIGFYDLSDGQGTPPIYMYDGVRICFNLPINKKDMPFFGIISLWGDRLIFCDESTYDGDEPIIGRLIDRDNLSQLT